MPQSNEPMRRSEAAQRIRAANQRGVSPGSLVQGPPRAVPSQTTEVPKSQTQLPQTPLPTPRPPGAPVATPVPAPVLPRSVEPAPLTPAQRVDQGGPMQPPAGGNQAEMVAMLQRLGASRMGAPPVDTGRPIQGPAPTNLGMWPFNTGTANRDGTVTMAPSAASQMAEAIRKLFSASTTAAPAPQPPKSSVAPPPTGPREQDPRFEQGKRMLIEEMAKKNKRSALPPDSDPMNAMAQATADDEGPDGGNLPRNARPTQGSPSQQQGPVFYDRPTEIQEPKRGRGRPKVEKPAKTVTGKGSSKGHSDNYYHRLGVPPGDKTAAAHAYQALQAKARNKPGSLTLDEDKLLASSNRPEYNKSILDEDILKRFQSYGASQKKIDEMRNSGKVGQTPQNRINERFPSSAPQSTVIYGAPLQKQEGLRPDDPASSMVTKSIDEAGRPVRTPPVTKGGPQKRTYQVKDPDDDDDLPNTQTKSAPDEDDDED